MGSCLAVSKKQAVVIEKKKQKLLIESKEPEKLPPKLDIPLVDDSKKEPEASLESEDDTDIAKFLPPS